LIKALVLQLLHQERVHKNTTALYGQGRIKTSVEDFYRKLSAGDLHGNAVVV